MSPVSLKAEAFIDCVVLSLIEFHDDGLTTSRVRLSPATASRLGQILIDLAAQMEPPT
jgi:hypothetical protein